MTAFLIAAGFNLYWIVAFPETVKNSVKMKDKFFGAYWYVYNLFAVFCLVTDIWK